MHICSQRPLCYMKSQTSSSLISVKHSVYLAQHLLAMLLFVVFVCSAVAFEREYNPDDVTMLEDVVGEYQWEFLKRLIMNRSKTVDEKLQKVLENSEKSVQLHELQNTVNTRFEKLETTLKQLENRLDNFEITTRNDSKTQRVQLQHSLDDAASGIQTTLRQQFDSFMIEFQNLRPIYANDCLDLYETGMNVTGAYWLTKYGVNVLCDMESGDGGWLVIQKRRKLTKQVNFDQDWTAYKIGFGNIHTEFWIGNDFLHTLTHQRNYELLIEMNDYQQGPLYARYSSFQVGDESSLYMLDLGNYTGNASDAFSYHHKQVFTTRDRDNDVSDTVNCAQYFSGGWWYNRFVIWIMK